MIDWHSLWRKSNFLSFLLLVAVYLEAATRPHHDVFERNGGMMGRNGNAQPLNPRQFQRSRIPSLAFSIGFPPQDGFVTHS